MSRFRRTLAGALWPYPRLVEVADAMVAVPPEGRVLLQAPRTIDIAFSGRQVHAAIQEAAGGEWSIVASAAGSEHDFVVALNLVQGSTSHPEGYTIRVASGRIDAVASTPAGLHNAAQTLCQLARACGRSWPACRIVDWPDFPNRGVLLDISRGKVPTQETLYGLVDRLASLKYNQLQLYTEHTFAYRQHPEVWALASPMTGEEVLALDVYCRERHVELVPNQNTFGHMRPWLIHDRYRDLAEAPDGCNTRWGWFAEPFSLNPGDPRSLDLVESLLDELLPHFSSRQVNVGCDETVDLGEGRSRDAVAERGVGPVFVDFLLKIHREVTRRGRTMQFWGDIIMEHPELAEHLPRDVIALEWGYEADHPFDSHGEVFAATGAPFYVCPGTSSWNSIAGRTENALANLENAARNGLRHGAIGYLVTDWGDNGHWQPHATSLLPWFYGAAQAWCGAVARREDAVHAADLHLFGCDSGSMAQIAYDLGAVDLLLGVPIHNMAALFRILQSPGDEVAAHLAAHASPKVMRKRIATAQSRFGELRIQLEGCRSSEPDGALLLREFAWAIAALDHACSRGLWMLDGAKRAGNARELASQWDRVAADFGTLWHARFRHGGYAESVALLHKVGAAYVDREFAKDPESSQGR